jgi:hypothetical protein
MNKDAVTIIRPSSIDEKEIWEIGTDFNSLVQNEIREAVFDFMTNATFSIFPSSIGRMQMRVIAAEPIDAAVLSIDFGALLKREWEDSGEDPKWMDAFKVACAEIIGEN